MNIAAFREISNGKYNLGEIRIEGEGDAASLTKVNNHRWRTSLNNVAVDSAQCERVRNALITAIRQESGLHGAALDRILGRISHPDVVDTPLLRRDVKAILSQVDAEVAAARGAELLRDMNVMPSFSNQPELEKLIGRAGYACVPPTANDPFIAQYIVMATARAYQAGTIPAGRQMSGGDLRVHVYHTIFEGVPGLKCPSDSKLRQMTPAEFFARIEADYTKLSNVLFANEGDFLIAQNGFFRHIVPENRVADQLQGMLAANTLQMFFPRDLIAFGNDMQAFDLTNTQSMLFAGSNMNNQMREYEAEGETGIDEKIADRVRGDVFRASGMSFTVNNETINFSAQQTKEEKHMVLTRTHELIDNLPGATLRQRRACKLLLTQGSTLSVRTLAGSTGLLLDEHSPFNYELVAENDGTFRMNLSNVDANTGRSVTLSYRVDHEGNISLEDFHCDIGVQNNR